MSIFERLAACGCGHPDCYFCWVQKQTYTTTAVPKKYEDQTDNLELYDILFKVSLASGVSIEDIKGKSRYVNDVIARQMYCYYAKIKWEFKKARKEEIIGKLINRDRTTVIHSCENVEDKLSSIVKDKKYMAIALKLGIVNEKGLTG